MEVPAARLEDGLQLRDLLAQLVMPRVAGRTGGAGVPAGTAGDLSAGQPAAQPAGQPAAQSAAQPAPPLPNVDHGTPDAARRPGARRVRAASPKTAGARPLARPAPTAGRTEFAATIAAAAARTGATAGHEPAGADAALTGPLLTAEQIDTAARDLVRGATQSLDQLLAGRSGSRAAIAEAVLAPVARRLGVLWEEDDASFADVSAALGLLSRRFAALPGQAVRTGQQAPDAGVGSIGTILLVAAPGETHLFGLSVVGAAFEEAGWTVMCHPAASRAEIIEHAASRWIDVLAITVSWTGAMRSVPDLVAAARLASLNPDLRVLAGGGAVAQLDDACAALHADAVAVSAVQAVAVAQQMLPARATPV